MKLKLLIIILVAIIILNLLVLFFFPKNFEVTTISTEYLLLNQSINLEKNVFKHERFLNASSFLQFANSKFADDVHDEYFPLTLGISATVNIKGEIISDKNISVFFTDEENFEKFINNESFDSIISLENESYYKFSLAIPSNKKFFICAASKEPATTILYSLRISWQEIKPGTVFSFPISIANASFMKLKGQISNTQFINSYYLVNEKELSNYLENKSFSFIFSSSQPEFEVILDKHESPLFLLINYTSLFSTTSNILVKEMAQQNVVSLAKENKIIISFASNIILISLAILISIMVCKAFYRFWEKYKVLHLKGKYMRKVSHLLNIFNFLRKYLIYKFVKK